MPSARPFIWALLPATARPRVRAAWRSKPNRSATTVAQWIRTGAWFTRIVRLCSEVFTPATFRSTRKDLAARPTEIVTGHECNDPAGDLPAAVRGRLDRIGEILVLVADETKIDDRNARTGSFANGRIVDHAQRRRADPSLDCFGIARVVNRADCSRQAAMPHGFDHSGVIPRELAADQRQLLERIGD